MKRFVTLPAFLLAGATLCAAGELGAKGQAAARPASNPAANLLVNGDFRQSPRPARYQTVEKGSKEIAAWSVVKGDVDVDGPDPNMPLFRGMVTIDLDGTMPGAVQQTFDTKPNQSYRVSFVLSGNFQCGPGMKTLRLTVDESTQDFPFDVSGRTATNMGWTDKSVSFMATGAKTTLQFESLDDPKSSCGPVIANVSVVESEDTTLAVSDEHVQYSTDGRTWTDSVAAWVHPAWPALPGATWVWRTKFVNPQEAKQGSEIVTFRRQFGWTGADETRATISISVDNAWEVAVNGSIVGSAGRLDAASNDDQLWHEPVRYAFPLKKGQNEILIRAINYHAPGGSSDPQANPAGVLFRVSIAGADAAAMTAAIANTGKVDVYGILFDLDKTTIKRESLPALDEISRVLKADPSLKLEVAGHTDNTGSKQHNAALSNGRANSVVRVLVKDYGIDPARLQPKGYGDTKPVAPNDTDNNRAKNRRVELRKL
jgi:choice-of-anchor C domain-containing protein